ncbi:hypothetical protein [Kineosporia babensis]|uniref:DUF2180 family protein n=1 Tax=Kineosporia babensis TaxID=499548 RepID=A0A9X1NJA7_9ACTN|nr:hypothetical protein [Kineosporia babensis]MCD5315110.1 hypothetical protein [Kineosporia babensis]
MHCLDCALHNGHHATAVGCCHYCGAATCLEHATVVQPTAGPIGMVPRAPKRRIVSCLNCTPNGQSLSAPAPIVLPRTETLAV